MPTDFTSLETLIRHDPRGRGVASYLHDGKWLAAGMLEHAARDLAERAGAVAIVTGFCVADIEPPVAETDGPPGTLYLARALQMLGREVVLISDEFTVPLLKLGTDVWRLDVSVLELPTQREKAEQAIDTLMRSSLGKQLSHIISIERVGPSHTLESIQAQRGNSPSATARFDAEVPQRDRDASHNMRGVIIDDYTAPAHLLFEAARADNPPISTIGIGDGGNEIGMGTIPWELLREALHCAHAGRIICRIATDFLILAGVSNWGAYALACAVANLRGRSDLIDQWNEAGQQQLIELLVREGGAVDGLTQRHEATVDGLPLDQYLSMLEEIRRVCL